MAGTCLASCGGKIADIGGPSTSGEHDSSEAEARGGVQATVVRDAGDAATTDPSDASSDCAGFLTSSPTDKKTKVGAFEDVTLEFCSPLDPATVTSLHVELLAPHATVGRKAVDVSYDAANRRIVLHPTLPMNADATYRVRATGLKTTAGTPVADVAFSFHTVRSPMIHAYGPIGGVQQSQVGTLDSEGRLWRSVIFTAGPDGIGGTADDVDTRYGYTLTYSSTGYTQVTSSAGPDGIFDTADDVIYDIVGREDSELAPYYAWTARSPGPDGKLGTADDGYINCGRQYYTADGRPGRIEWFKNAGADGIPFTDDDPIMSYSTYDATTPDDPQVFWYGKPGLDGLWRTSDDRLDAVLLNTVDELGRSLLEIHQEPGPDGLWPSADDIIDEVHTYSYDPSGLLTGHRTYYNPGPDKIWRTADDALSYVGTYAYDPAGNVTSYDSNGVHYVFAPQL